MPGKRLRTVSGWPSWWQPPSSSSTAHRERSRALPARERQKRKLIQSLHSSHFTLYGSTKQTQWAAGWDWRPARSPGSTQAMPSHAADIVTKWKASVSFLRSCVLSGSKAGEETGGKCARGWGAPYLWLTISTLPYCSIQSLPTMMLCTQQVGFVHVYASLCLQNNPKPRSLVRSAILSKHDSVAGRCHHSDQAEALAQQVRCYSSRVRT